MTKTRFSILFSLLFCGYVWADSPIDAYREYLTTIKQAQSFNELYPYMVESLQSRYEDIIRSAQSNGIAVSDLMQRTLDIMRAGMDDDYELKQYVIGTEGAVILTRKQSVTEIDMTRVGEEWRIRREVVRPLPNFSKSSRL